MLTYLQSDWAIYVAVAGMTIGLGLALKAWRLCDQLVDLWNPKKNPHQPLTVEAIEGTGLPRHYRKLRDRYFLWAMLFLVGFGLHLLLVYVVMMITSK